MELSDHFLSEWERLSPLIQQALDRNGNTHSLEDIKELVLCGEAQFWPGEKSVGVTELMKAPNYLTLHGWIAAGELDEVLEMTDRAAKWGKEQGCERMVLSGRRGWERAMRHTDFSFKHVTLERML